MRLPYNKNLIPFAKSLRKNATPQENHLWYDFLHSYQPRFQRQKAIDSYIADFYCHAAHLVIEIDGAQHFTEEGLQYDRIRTAVLESHELRVIRFTNREIDQYFDSVCRMIDEVIITQLYPNRSDMDT